MAIRFPKVQTFSREVNQLQQNIFSVLEPIFSIVEGRFVGTFSGFSTTVQSTVNWERAVVGGPITMMLPQVSGISNATSLYVTGMPSYLRPVTEQRFIVSTANNGGARTASLLILTPDGRFDVRADLDGNFFTSSGTKVLDRATFTYISSI
jgi:hypothetical protein